MSYSRGNFTGTVRVIGPGRQYATIAAALAAANPKDLLLCAFDTPPESVNINKNVWLDFSACNWNFLGIPSGTLTGGGLGAIAVSATDVRIYAGTVSGVGLDLPSADSTSVIRVTTSSGNVVIIGGNFLNNQNGVCANSGTTHLTLIDTVLTHNGLEADLDHAHNVYISELACLNLINVTSTNPTGAHAIKSRAGETHVNGGVFESPKGSCFDIPSAGQFTIENATLRKLAISEDEKVIGYALENFDMGLRDTNWIQNCTFDLQRACTVMTAGGVITFAAGNTIIPANSLVAAGAGTVIGLGASPPDLIVAHNLTVNATTAVPYTGVIATFTCSNSSLGPASFTGTVDWNDGSGVLAGTVTGGSGAFQVAGAVGHSYATAGSKTATVVLYKSASPGATATATSTVTVADAAPVGTWTATVTYAGGPYTFSTVGAVDMGDYVDPQGRFTQKCLAARNAGLPDFLVMFRPDTTSSRGEVVFELGRCFGNPGGTIAPTPFAMAPYSVVIAKDGVTQATVSATLGHYYYSRWRWQSAPRPATVTIASLMAAKLVPPYDKNIVYPPGKRAGGIGPTGVPLVYTGPMSTGGMNPSMIDTGETNDIGVVTEYQADYIMYEDSTSLGYIMAEAEGCASCPWHLRDENTLAPLDFLTYPNAGGQYYNVPWVASSVSTQSVFYPQISHAPDPAYVPAMITGDPFLIEELQLYTTNFLVVISEPTWGVHDAIRAYAWMMRNVAHCVVATPNASMPSWIKPRSYWLTLAANALAFSLPLGPNAAAGTYQQRFSDMSVALNTYGEVAGNMEEYTCAVFCHMCDLGIPGWTAMRDWKMQGVIARTNNTSGYNRRVPTSYIREDAQSQYGAVHADWAALYAWNVGHNFYTDWTNASGDGTHLSPSANLDFCNQTMACINWGFRQGVPGTATGHTWLSAEMVGKASNMRWAIS